MNDSSRIVTELDTDFVELYKILKFEGLVESGGSAKQVIADGRIKVNGLVELQKRKKISAGDCIEFEDLSINVIRRNNDEQMEV